VRKKGAEWFKERFVPRFAPWPCPGASNFFELAVATAIALYGPGSGAALATVGDVDRLVGIATEAPEPFAS